MWLKIFSEKNKKGLKKKIHLNPNQSKSGSTLPLFLRGWGYGRFSRGIQSLIERWLKQGVLTNTGLPFFLLRAERWHLRLKLSWTQWAVSISIHPSQPVTQQFNEIKVDILGWGIGTDALIHKLTIWFDINSTGMMHETLYSKKVNRERDLRGGERLLIPFKY